MWIVDWIGWMVFRTEPRHSGSIHWSIPVIIFVQRGGCSDALSTFGATYAIISIFGKYLSMYLFSGPPFLLIGQMIGRVALLILMLSFLAVKWKHILHACCLPNTHLFVKNPLQFHDRITSPVLTSLFLSSCPHRHTFKANSPNGALETDMSVIWVDLLKAGKEIPAQSSYISNDYKLKTSCVFTS